MQAHKRPRPARPVRTYHHVQADGGASQINALLHLPHPFFGFSVPHKKEMLHTIHVQYSNATKKPRHIAAVFEAGLPYTTYDSAIQPSKGDAEF